MKSHPPALRRLVVTAKRRGQSYHLVAREFRLPVGTVKTWCSRMGETPHCEGEKQQHETPLAGAWMQSLHHETAHFIINGHAACEANTNGAKIVSGSTWLKHDGCVRKCLRCMKHAENDEMRDGERKTSANTTDQL